MAALEDEEFSREVLKKNDEGRRFLKQELQGMGLEAVPSHTNFVLVDLKRDSREIFESLIKKGIIVRPGHIWDLPTFIRITVGTPDQNEMMIRVLNEVLDKT